MRRWATSSRSLADADRAPRPRRGRGKAQARGAASSSGETSIDSGVCHTARPSPIPTATRSCSTGATRRTRTVDGPRPDVKRTDFVAWTRGLERAKEFYGETLGLARNPNTSSKQWVEYETGNLTPRRCRRSAARLRSACRTSARRGANSKDSTCSSRWTRSTRAFATACRSWIPTAIGCSCTAATSPLERFDVPEQDVLRTDFIGVNVRDRAKASEFYSGLGLTRNPNSSDEWPEFEASNVGLVLSTPEQKGGGEHQPEYGVALRVADVARRCETLAASGVEFECSQVYDSGVCHMAFFKDPDGNGSSSIGATRRIRDGTQPESRGTRALPRPAASGHDGRALALHRPARASTPTPSDRTEGQSRRTAAGDDARAGRGRAGHDHRRRASRSSVRPTGSTFAPLTEEHEQLYSLVGWDEKFAAHNAAVWQHGLLVVVPEGRRARQAALRARHELDASTARSSGACS